MCVVSGFAPFFFFSLSLLDLLLHSRGQMDKKKYNSQCKKGHFGRYRNLFGSAGARMRAKQSERFEREKKYTLNWCRKERRSNSWSKKIDWQCDLIFFAYIRVVREGEKWEKKKILLAVRSYWLGSVTKCNWAAYSYFYYRNWPLHVWAVWPWPLFEPASHAGRKECVQEERGKRVNERSK